MSEQIMGSKTQYFLLTQSNRMNSGDLWYKGTVAAAAKPTNRFSKYCYLHDLHHTKIQLLWTY